MHGVSTGQHRPTLCAPRLAPQGWAAIVADSERDLHRVSRAGEIRTLALGLELEAVTAPGLDLDFQPRAARDPFKPERVLPVAPERARGDRRREGPDL